MEDSTIDNKFKILKQIKYAVKTVEKRVRLLTIFLIILVALNLLNSYIIYLIIWG